MTKPADEPIGNLVLRTLAMPADTNANGDIFGGWLLSQMDIAGGLEAKQRSRSRVATVAINAMEFHRPVYVGDVVACYTHLERAGRTSMTIRVEAWCIRQAIEVDRIKVTEGIFTFVAIGQDGQPIPIDRAA